MKRILSVIVCISIFFAVLGTVGAQQATTRQVQENKTYIVLLEAPALRSPYRVSFMSNEEDRYRQALIELQNEIKSQIPMPMTRSLRGANIGKNYSYTDILNGFTITCDGATAEYIKTIDGVKCVLEDFTFNRTEEDEIIMQTTSETTLPEGGSVNFSSANAGNMINVKSAYDKGYNGKGRAIAVIDSGMDVNHSYYTVTDESTVRFTKEDIAGIIAGGTNVSATADMAYRNSKIPYAYNYAANKKELLTDKHGGHVSGIVAGNAVLVDDGVISGIAPEAQILFFGVFGDGGEAQFTDIAAALEDAVKFKVDAINISIGTTCASENYKFQVYQEAVENAKNAGCSVVISSGNDNKTSHQAAYIDYSSADNMNYLNSSKVGAVQNQYSFMPYLEDENGNKYPCGVKGKENAFSYLEIADCGFGTEAEIAGANVSGKIAFIKVPDPYIASSISVYGTRAVKAGAAAVVIANNSVDIADGAIGAQYPLFIISDQSGQDISDSTKLKFTGEKAVIKRTDFTVVNNYSSYGNSDNLDISVDFVGVGGNVYSAYGTKNEFASMTGTSMAAPQVTGATTLMYQYVEEVFPTYTGVSKVMLVKNLLASTAATVYASNGAIESPRKVGSGLIQLDKAMTSKVILKGKDSQETRITLGDNLTSEFDVTFTAYNLGEEDVTFGDVTVELSTDDYKYYEERNSYGTNGLKALTAVISGAETVTVPANGSCDVTVTVKLADSEIGYLNAAMVNGFFVDGKVTLSGADKNCDVGIPFLGFYGEWTKMLPVTQSRLVNNFDFSVLTADGFNPTMKLFKENNQFVLPVSDNPSADLEGAIVAFRGNPQRNTYMTVKFDSKPVIEDVFLTKGYVSGDWLDGILAENLKAVSRITIEFRLPYDVSGEHKVIHTVNVVKDNIMPVVSDIYVSETDGSNYSYVEVMDNYDISAVSSFGFSKETGVLMMADAYINEKSATAGFDITGLDNIYYFVYDGALNSVMVSPEVKINVSDNTAIYSNNTLYPVTGVCMIAVYDQNDKMTELRKLSSSTTLNAYDEETFDVSLYSGKKYKLFFWKDVSKSCEPVCEAYTSR